MMQILGSFQAHAGGMAMLRFLPRSGLLVTGAEVWDNQAGDLIGELALWDVQSKKCVVTSKKFGRTGWFGVSSDESTIGWGGTEGRVELVHVPTLLQSGTLTNGGRGYWPLAFAPTAPLLAGADSISGVVIWDVSTAAPLAVYRGKKIDKLSFAGDSHELVLGTDQGVVKMWEWQSNGVTVVHSHGCRIRSLAISHLTDVVASSGLDGSVIISDYTQHESIATWSPSGNAINCLTFTPSDSILLCLGDDALLFQFDYSSSLQSELTPFDHMFDEGVSIDMNPGENVVAVGHMDGMVSLWRLN